MRFTAIAAQCCASNQPVDDPQDACRRRATEGGGPGTSNEDCIGGFWKSSTNPFVEKTYGETVTECAARGLVLCEQSCSGKGCAYNYYPVYSAKPCPLARPPLSPPLPPPSPPSAPPGTIPERGIAILKGNSEINEVVGCLWPGDEDVTSNETQQLRFTAIAAQCCASDQEGKDACRRRATEDGGPSTSNEDCIAGFWKSSTNPFVEKTYGETVTACAARGLVLCEQSCDGEGCAYNNYPVYSGLPCPFARPPSSPPLPPPSPPSSPPVVIPERGIAILKGNSQTNETLACLWPGDEAVTSSIGRNVSQQL